MTLTNLPWPRLCAGLAVLIALAAGTWYAFRAEPAPPPPPPRVAQAADLEDQVYSFCGSACHASPPADIFPRREWKMEVERGYRFFDNSGLPLRPPPIEQVIRYFESRAPEELPAADIRRAERPLAVTFERGGWPGPKAEKTPAVSFVDAVRLTGDEPQLIACDMSNGLVMLLNLRDPSPAWRTLAKLESPAHAEVIDLDGDGVKDLLVADLGSFLPTERHCGKVVWLRGKSDGTFAPVTLLEGVGRVADVRAGRFRDGGKYDLVVAAFGLHQTGELLLLENGTTDWSRPVFVKRTLERRTGAIHVPVTDLDGDGRPDFVCLFSQEHEQVYAYLNRGGGDFEAKRLWAAPHPGYGCSGIELADMDGDGDLDVLLSNGDVLDEPYLFKPYHGVQWLENQGGLKYRHRAIGPMYGVHRAVAGDIDGDGDVDVVAAGFLPASGFPKRKQMNADALVVFEQTAKGEFARHTLSSVTCDHVSCVLADVAGTGRKDIVAGNFGAAAGEPPVLVWRNQGPPKR